MPNLVIAASASGDTTLLAAVTTRRWLVRKLVLVAKTAVDIKFKSGATDITGVMAFAANQTLILPWQNDKDPAWLVAGAINQALVINLSAAIVVGGVLVYDWLEG
jgi:hypothetical protein